MQNIFYNFIQELRVSNSSNYKLQVLQKYKDNKEISLFLKMVYDKVFYTYNIRLTNININKTGNKEINLDNLKVLYTREYTGNKAIQYLQELFDSYDKESQEVLSLIIERDLKSGVNAKSINKVFNCIFELPYMRCSKLEKIKYINYPAFLQEKMDGTYRTIIKENNEVSFYSRSSEEYFYPKLKESILKSNIPDGAYIGELMVNLDDDLNAQDKRFKSNGLLNSLEVPDDITFYVWDFLTLEEFKNSYSNRDYKTRFENIVICDMMKKVQSTIVNSFDEALKITRKWISEDKEGGVLKDFNAKFENKTSNYQIKLKTMFDVDVKITGFTEGKNKRANTFGSIMFESSDGLLKGSCSGITDDLLQEISDNREKYLNTIMTVQATDISKGKNSDTYSLTFPRFLCLRSDKTIADSLEDIKNNLNMVKSVED
jgi:ATP dependent DNA ligase domain|nr:MAG TPA: THERMOSTABLE DNA LIGASE [Caudoviricetes sp.]